MTLLVTLLSAMPYIRGTENDQVATTVFDGNVTVTELAQVCQHYGITPDLKKWIRVKMYFDSDTMTNRWIYIKGKDADMLFTVTKRKGQEVIHLNIQRRYRKGDPV
jgi:hypothetical protein